MTEHMTSRSKPPSATDSADLDSYLRVHRALRTSAARFARAVAAGEPARAEAQRRWYRGFADEIRCHHHIEDELLFSALAERVATYDDDHRPTLTADHAELDDLLDGLTAALAPDVPSALAVRLANAISEHLQQHLDYEDDEIVPLFARHFTTAEFEDLNQRAIKMTPPRQLLFTAPWMMAQLDEAEQKALLASAPKAMHLLWFVSRCRYARLERRAFGVAS
jgi:hypothetical protein